MIDPYETERKLLAISSPCGAPPDDIPEYQYEENSVFIYPVWCRRCNEIITAPCGTAGCPLPPESETMRRLEALAQLLARECPLRQLLGSVQQTEAEG